jgi:dUTP pyrophosphatase
MQIKFLDPRLTEFKPATEHSAGYDLRACVDEELHLAPGETKKIKTGVAIWQTIPDLNNPDEEYRLVPCAFILARSGLGCRGIAPRNKPGLIDADYQGEIVVCLHNGSEDWCVIKPMERIAQLVFTITLQPRLDIIAEFSDKTERGDGGFGSTGTL